MLRIKLDRIFAVAIAITLLLKEALSLECYVCNNQDGNTEKCLKTIQTCEPDHNRCMTIIRWSTMPYWAQGAEKQYYVSKRCATEQLCEREIKGNMPLCHYIWYEDWKCAECCQGDRCNFYVTLGSSSLLPSKFIVTSTLVISAVFSLALGRR